MSIGNLDDTIQWFEENLGFELVTSTEVYPGTKVAFIRNGDFELELFECEGSKPTPEEHRSPATDLMTRGTRHMCFGARKLDELVERLKANSVNIALGPMDAFGLYTAFINGPDDILMEFIELKD
jgi:catechol 2,3-dioxygenase-like lactoylglutathione lyase family enzyme